MITETHACTRCGSSDLTRNGKTRAGKQKYHCRACGHYGTLNASYGYSEERKGEILRAYHERSSLRGLGTPSVLLAKPWPLGKKKPIVCRRWPQPCCRPIAQMCWN